MRELSSEERGSALRLGSVDGAFPAQRLALVFINSIFIDWIDRRFLYRGMLNMSFVFLCLLGFLYFLLISPDPQLDFCCSPANSFVLPMCSMMSDLGAPDARSRCEVLSARAPWRPGIGPV
ncbi:hypothetical protein BRM01_11460 [Xanthomonas oryzae pv. oryzae]|nr:hypothetical protein BRM01_11460 [Xanthomonas oryzae pv. oryzae]